MPSAPHVIQRNHLLLRLAPGTDGRAVQKRAAAALQSRPLLEALDAALTAAGHPNDWLTLERLELDLGHLDSAQLERQLLDRLPDLLRREVAEALVAAKAGTTAAEAAELDTVDETAWVAWLYFLHHGALPTHWPAPASIADWEADFMNLLATATDAQQATLRAALAKPQPAQRLIRQFSVPLVVAVLGLLDATVRPHQTNLAAALTPLLRQQKGYSGDLGEVLLLELVRRTSAGQPANWPALLKALTAPLTQAPPGGLTQLAQAALAMVQVSALPPDAPAAAEVVSESLWATEVEFVQNAGIVLLHPFLPACFAACGWLVDDEFIDETARMKAVLLVHFLATGARQAPEFELQLPKLLCGVPAGAVLNRRLRLGQTARSEALALLKAAIHHWTALKNTSPDGLREAFLQREGKLELAADGHTILTVEQRAQDVLLDRLPYGWGVSVVKFPWMPERLTVNWN